jgi:D-3-phosphoglycerate dehydrogenase / 2-oxoglutarate reductase
MSNEADDAPVVLVYDPITTVAWTYEPERQLLAEAGVRLTVPTTPRASDEELFGADVVIVSDPFPTELISHLTRCAGLLCYRVGMDTVDVDAARAAGVPVTNIAGYCTEEVSDHALALLLALQRRIVPFAAAASRGDWDVYDTDDFRSIRRLCGQRLGIVGLGRIGSRVAVKAGAFGMTVAAYDPYLAASPSPDVTMLSLEELLRTSDAIVLCSALTDTSRSLIDAERLALMLPGAVLVNVARGGLVDEEALIAALRSGRLGGAALDVRAQEPPPDDDPLRQLPNVVLTQHIGATSRESHADLHALAAERALELLQRAGRLPKRAPIGT